jgi:hypothetical protein
MVQEEATRAEITLSGDGDAGAMCASLTPEMAIWVGAHVSPTRQGALAELESAARRIPLGKGLGGLLIEVEEDKLKREREKRRSDVYKEFHDNHAKILQECEEVENDYDRMRLEEGGRDAIVPSRILEWGVLFPLVLIPESMLNYSALRDGPGVNSDATAAGITIIAGLMVAMSAHLCGTFMKQFNHWMRPDDKEQQWKGLRSVVIGIVLLVVVLAVVGYYRYYYLNQMQQTARMLGQSPPNIFVALVGTLGGNFGVFLLGSAFAYLLHDSNPDFSSLKKKCDKLKSNITSKRKAELTDKLIAIDARLKRDVDKRRAVSQQMNGKLGYDELREQFSRFLTKDHEVVGLLKKYQARLAATIEQRDSNYTFERPFVGVERGGERVKVSLADFAASPLHLYKA